jgi:hypothetical protein
LTLTILDLFAGTGSSTQAFEDAGHNVIRVELDTQHKAHLHADVGALTVKQVFTLCGGTPDFIWASPPCTTFSIASVSHHWRKEGDAMVPKHQGAANALALVEATLRLIHAVGPRYWLMENPRGMLRKFPLMASYQRRTVTYCQYGDTRMKPTDLWGVMPQSWVPRPMCKNGSPCHEAAPRGAKTGTQGLSGAVIRSRVPYGLSQEVCQAIASAMLLKL